MLAFRTPMQIKSERELQTLTIPKSCFDDAGNYMVKANNEAGVAKCYATLVIKPPGSDKHGMKMRLIESSHSVQSGVLTEGHQPPAITRAFHDFTVRQGKPCSMEVIIVGRPQPTVSLLSGLSRALCSDAVVVLWTIGYQLAGRCSCLPANCWSSPTPANCWSSPTTFPV